ncbi:guanine nucleotide-binding protein G(I)/G(S)/G(O) subunit gamma-7 isoform X2 [Rhinolophus sinicus]|uniref:guanine nucleotide-binding protein G(I)/G(S)/G(O) subunit gamma-7 isoform X2 n=1 Tax=Rhinolophus sinicus TaxID=89399 RepID=UPI003D7B5C42
MRGVRLRGGAEAAAAARKQATLQFRGCKLQPRGRMQTTWFWSGRLVPGTSALKTARPHAQGRAVLLGKTKKAGRHLRGWRWHHRPTEELRQLSVSGECQPGPEWASVCLAETRLAGLSFPGMPGSVPGRQGAHPGNRGAQRSLQGLGPPQACCLHLGFAP